MISLRSLVSVRGLFVLFVDFLVGIVAQTASPFLIRSLPVGWQMIAPNMVLYFVSCLIFVFLVYIFDLYKVSKFVLRKEELFKAVAVIALMIIFSGFLDYFFEAQHFLGRRVHVAQWILAVACVYLLRIIFSTVSVPIVATRKVLIVGCGESGQLLWKRIAEHPNTDVCVLGFLDINKNKAGKIVNGVEVFWQREGLVDAVVELNPDVLIIAMRKSHLSKVIKDVVWLAMRGVEVWDLPAAYEKLLGRIPLQYIDDTWLLNVTAYGGQIYPKLKRIFDIFVALFSLILSFPLVLLTMLAIRIESKGPVILRQKRVGKNGKIITLYKLRTMYQCCPFPGDNGTILGDTRVTRLGKFIRKLHVDELPQFINVLKGELSVIGPRSELEEFIHYYFKDPSKWKNIGMEDLKNQYVCSYPTSDYQPLNLEKVIPFFEQRFLVDQGITGWAQIKAPLLTSSYDDMINKVEYDLFYVKNISFFLDLTIILETIKIVFWGKGK